MFFLFRDQMARKLEAVNEIKEPLKSNLLNGKWELIYTTSQAVLQTQVIFHRVPSKCKSIHPLFFNMVDAFLPSRNLDE